MFKKIRETKCFVYATAQTAPFELKFLGQGILCGIQTKNDCESPRFS